MPKLLKALAALSVVVAMGAAQGALFDRGPDMVYDDVLDISWVRNASLCQTLNNCVNPFADPRTRVVGGMR